jgi:hypothetical protein
MMLRSCFAVALLAWAAGHLAAQTRVGFNPSGMWSPMYHEDELERTDPGSSAGDYLGIPITDEMRYRADSWDADYVSVLERQCVPHSAIYGMRGPSALMISTIMNPQTNQITAFIIDGSYSGPRTVWMDGRARPSKYAAHTWAGFSLGTWEGDTLRVETTHIKAGYLRRNGITFSDEAKLTEFFQMQDKYLTLTTVAEDPLSLTEPFVRSESWVWNPYQVFTPIAGFGQCQPHPELPRPPGWVPHHLPGTNQIVKEFSESYGVPFEASRGGAETMYPEYQKKLKTMTIPRPKVFESKFQREHPAGVAPAAPAPGGPKP